LFPQVNQSPTFTGRVGDFLLHFIFEMI
jgi:hypothetical protein